MQRCTENKPLKSPQKVMRGSPPPLPPPYNFGTSLKFSLMCIAFVFQSLSESPNQDGTMKWYNGISVQMSCFKRFIFSRIDAALFSLAFSCILTFNIMRRGRNTARGKSILVAGPIHVHKKRELA